MALSDAADFFFLEYLNIHSTFACKIMFQFVKIDKFAFTFKRLETN